jgi:NIPSNAP
MERRQFLAASLAATAVAAASPVAAQPGAPVRDFYLLRRYNLLSGNQLKTTEAYFTAALFPALGRFGFSPVGAFRLDIGPETPSYYLLIPHGSVEPLATLDLSLAADAEFLKAAEPFWNATSASPAFQRAESSLLISFEGWPSLTPPSTSARAKRIFQLRTYESPSNFDHVRKVQMFHSGEFQIFQAAGFHPVFFGDTLIGSRMPNLTYMLSFADMAELEAKWDVFRNDPNWKKLSSDPRFAFDQIVTNISNLMLSPRDCSQI